eukprot:NODE_72_length_23514_cov_0.560624.p14 type:complete len:116 gc:universal NODE_72_length_23514_cov_0.560624:12636-12983(+)
MLFSGMHKLKASTISLSILVVIEMLNAMNSLSENESLLKMPLWRNWYLIFAIMLSIGLHFMILEVAFFQDIFHIVHLNWDEWVGVLTISMPVIVIDEVLKLMSRTIIYPVKSKKE